MRGLRREDKPVVTSAYETVPFAPPHLIHPRPNPAHCASHAPGLAEPPGSAVEVVPMLDSSRHADEGNRAAGLLVV